MFNTKEYQEGWKAFRNASGIDDFVNDASNSLWFNSKNNCPYSEHTNEYKMWERGWWDSAAAYNHNAGGDW